jgi:hypothetical protein
VFENIKEQKLLLNLKFQVSQNVLPRAGGKCDLYDVGFGLATAFIFLLLILDYTSQFLQVTAGHSSLQHTYAAAS